MNKNENVTKFECPVCHAQFALPEHQYVTLGTVIGKDSGLGTVHPMLANEQNGCEDTKPVIPVRLSKSEAKIEALRKAGVKGDFFAISGTGIADGSIARLEDGKMKVVADDDPIFAVIAEEIIKHGDVENYSLFRRWMLAQYVEGELSKDYWTGRPIGFTKFIHFKGYEYQFTSLLEEYRVQARLWKNKDLENYRARQRWMGLQLGIDMMEYDIRMAHEFVDGLPVRHCKGREYKRIHGRDIFVDELDEKLFSLMEMTLDNFRTAENAGQMYVLLDTYMKCRVKMNWKTPQCPQWVDAYKGVGAYYNLRNMIMFHGCLVHYDSEHIFTKEKSLGYVEQCAKQYAENGEGWCMLGMFRQLLKDNNIDLEKMQQEWRSK